MGAAQACQGRDLGAAEAGWTSEPDREEFRRLQPDRDTLARVAEATEGELIEPARLNAFVQDLPNRKIPLVETWIYSWWDLPYRKIIALALMLVALTLDWGARRWNGLA